MVLGLQENSEEKKDKKEIRIRKKMFKSEKGKGRARKIESAAKALITEAFRLILNWVIRQKENERKPNELFLIPKVWIEIGNLK